MYRSQESSHSNSAGYSRRRNRLIPYRTSHSATTQLFPHLRTLLAWVSQSWGWSSHSNPVSSYKLEPFDRNKSCKVLALEMAVEVIFFVVCLPAFAVMYAATYAYKRSKIEEELKAEETRAAALVADQRSFNEKSCVRCCASFNFLFKKRLSCFSCGFFVCKDCAIWSNNEKGWICNVCERQRVLRIQAGFYKSYPTSPESQSSSGEGAESTKVIRTLSKTNADSESELESDSGYNPSSAGSRNSSLRARTRRSLHGIFPLASAVPSSTESGNAHARANNKSHSGLSALHDGSSSIPLDPQVLEIREHIESLVEKIIGSDLDNANLVRLFNHPEYDRMFHSYHARLSEALTNLIFSLHMAITNQPLSPAETPTCTHAALRQVVAEVLQEAMGLPPLDVSEAGSVFSPSPTLSTEDEVDELLHSQTYEDILATAILNKVIEQYQQVSHKKRRLEPDESEESLVTLGTVTPSKGKIKSSTSKEVQTEDETENEEGSQRGPIAKGVRSDMNHDDSESDLGSESAGEDFSWADGNKGVAGPVQYTIEEKIEEITTTVEDTESDTELARKKPTPTPRRSVHEPIISKTLVMQETAMPDLDYLYAGLDFAKSHTVPFPEFGVDIVEGKVECERREGDGAEQDNEDEQEEKHEVQKEENDLFTLTSPVDEWTENWCFRKKKNMAAYAHLRGRMAMCDDPVPMLIPYPMEEKDLRTRIGSRDVDELSELSERNSVASLDYSSTDEEDVNADEAASRELQRLTGAIVSEFSQQDREFPEEDYRNNKRYAASPRPVSTSPSSGGELLNDLNKSDSETGNRGPPSPQLKPVPLPRKSKSSTPPPPPPQVAEEAINLHVRTLQSSMPVPSSSPTRLRRKNDNENGAAATTTTTTVSRPKFVPVGARVAPPRSLRFSSHPDSIVVHSGKVARFRCHVDASQKYDVCWFNGLQPLEDGGRYQVYQIGDEAILELYDTDSNDRGTYSCVIYNADGQTWVDFRLNVRGSVRATSTPEFLEPPTDVSASEGEAVSLSCRVGGYPEPLVTWYRGGLEIKRSDNVHIESSTPSLWLLTIHQLSPQDRGEYIAVAANRLGEVSSSAFLQVSPPGGRNLQQLTTKVNRTQDGVHKEAEKLLQSANQLSNLSNQLDSIDQTLHCLEAHFQERTWEERQAELRRDALHLHRMQKSASAAVRQATGRALDIVADTSEAIERSQWPSTQHVPVNGDIELPPATPGSIAEREHNKWLHPEANIPNNPYSAENLARRASLRSSDFTRREKRYPQSPDSPVETTTTTTAHDLILSDAPTKIDCGLKSVDSSRPLTNPTETKEANAQHETYRRDYYVSQHGEKVPRGERHTSSIEVEDMPTSPRARTESLNDVEEKVYVTAGKMNHLEDKIRQLEVQVKRVKEETPTHHVAGLEDKVAHVAAQVTQNEKQVSGIENQVSRFQQEIETRERQVQERDRLQRHSSERQRQKPSLHLNLNESSVRRTHSTNRHPSSSSASSPEQSPPWTASRGFVGSLERSNVRGSLSRNSLSASVDHLNMLTPSSPTVNGSSSLQRHKLSTSMLNLHRSEDGVHVNRRNPLDEVDNLPSVRELASRFQAAEQSQDSSRSATLERRKNVVTVVNIFPQPTSVSKSPKMEAKNVVTVDKGPVPSRGMSRGEVKEADSVDVAETNGGDTMASSGSNSGTDTFYPSVRELTRKFSMDDGSSGEGRLPEMATLAPPQTTASVKRVHSLTARSMSREFREAARRNTPRQMNRTLSISLDGDSESSSPSGLPSPDSVMPLHNSSATVVIVETTGRKGIMPPSSPYNPSRTTTVRMNGNSSPNCRSPDTDGHGYTSDESTTSTNSLPRRRALSKAMMSRAAFWERRVEENLTSDNDVSEDFTSHGFAPRQ